MKKKYKSFCHLPNQEGGAEILVTLGPGKKNGKALRLPNGPAEK